MKKNKAWVALLVALVLLTGCGRTASGEEEPSQPVQQEESAEGSGGETSQEEPEETQQPSLEPEQSQEETQTQPQEEPAEEPGETEETAETADTEAKKPAEDALWDTILADMAPYLEDAQEQDMSTEERIQANVGLGYDQISQAVLYMGMPTETPNTTYFFMGKMADGADSQAICDKLNQVMTGWVETYKQGYLQGNAEYDIIVSGDLVFAVMHQNAEDFAAICDYLKGLSN